MKKKNIFDQQKPSRKRSVISETNKELRAQANARRSRNITDDSRHHTKDGVR